MTKTGITTDQARALVSLASTRSFRATAGELGVSLVSVYHFIQRLEKLLGCGPLISPARDQRVALTAAGEEVLPRATAFVRSYEALRAHRRELRFSAYPTLTAHLWPRISSFEDEVGDYEIAFYGISDYTRSDHGEGLVDRTANGEIDIVVAPSGYRRARLLETGLYSWRLRCVLSQEDPRLGQERISIRDLADIKLLVSPKGHRSRQLLERAATRAGVRLDISLELIDQYLLASIAREGAGYAAVLPDDALLETANKLGPEVVDSRGNSLGGNYSLYYWKTHREDAQKGSKRAAAVMNLAKGIISAVNDIPLSKPTQPLSKTDGMPL